MALAPGTRISLYEILALIGAGGMGEVYRARDGNHADDPAALAAVQSQAAGPAGEVYGLERIKGGRHASVMRYTLNRSE